MAPTANNTHHSYQSTPSSPDPNKARLDHIIILLPYADLINPPPWLIENFTITPGGRHADDKTENKLILFHDGSYIELIAFIHDEPKHREGHWWGDKQPGIIDFAFTTTGDAKTHHDAIQQRLSHLPSSLNFSYASPVAGGRKRPDGQDVRWEVTFPQGARRGEVPFFCHDTTARSLRVPATSESMTHPNGAYGIKALGIMVKREDVAELSKVYAAILGLADEAEIDDLGIFNVGRINVVKETPEVLIRLCGPTDTRREGIVAEQGVLLGDLLLGGITNESTSKGRVGLDPHQNMGNIMIERNLSA